MSPDYTTFHPGNVQPGSQSGQFRVSNLKPEHPLTPATELKGRSYKMQVRAGSGRPRGSGVVNPLSQSQSGHVELTRIRGLFQFKVSSIYLNEVHV